MDTELKQKLLEQGTLIDAAIDRFLDNEEMYVSFLHKFTQDENFKGLKESIASGNVEMAFHHAHTIKGVAANLGLEGLAVSLNPLVEILRKGKMDGAEELFSSVEEKYHVLCEIIESH